MRRAFHLNVKHLQYFWAVARSGGVAKASERMHVTPQSISGQITLLEEAIGEPLLQRSGRHLELTDVGRMVYQHADRMFSAAEELQLALRDRPLGAVPAFRVGVSDVVVKSLAHRMLRPALELDPAPRLLCREGRLDGLLAEMAVHRLDLVLSDRPIPGRLNIVGFNHLLGECGVAFLAAEPLASQLQGGFPQCLHEAPMLLPGEDSAVRSRLQRWLQDIGVAPRVVAEFEDTALLKAFGEAAAGVFAVPQVVAAAVLARGAASSLRLIGCTDEVVEQVYAISAERRSTHPAVRAVGQHAHEAFDAGRTVPGDLEAQGGAGLATAPLPLVSALVNIHPPAGQSDPQPRRTAT